jgi:hypothetical protein
MVKSVSKNVFPSKVIAKIVNGLEWPSKEFLIKMSFKKVSVL